MKYLTKGVIHMNNNLNNYSNFLQKPVEINTVFSTNPIIGEVIETTDDSITVAPVLSVTGSDYYNSNIDRENTYYLPNSSILSMKEL
ncbi:hypothetical protein [Terrisporobacter sp.]|uniref:hypothetical protein n=1 Tax=Terrisporobacter sp. TaxID=1965305 RepID=UPI0026208E75|nr:hypothetical protein [Terrisporobacter sp.]